MCDMITDSMVLCVFIDSEKILSILQSDSTIDDFLWQVHLYWNDGIYRRRDYSLDC